MAEVSGALHALAVLVTLVGVGAGIRGVKLFLRGVRRADDGAAPLWIVRGIRGIVVAVSTGALGTGVLFGQRWLVVFGLIFLAEELYETGVLTLILRAGQRHAMRGQPCAPEGQASVPACRGGIAVYSPRHAPAGAEAEIAARKGGWVRRRPWHGCCFSRLPGRKPQ